MGDYSVNEAVSICISQFSIPNHPFNRADALNYLFWVIGNGFEWENGGLVEKTSSKFYQVQFSRSVYDEAQIRGQKLHHAYPIYECAKIFALPRNVTPEWRDAALESIDDLNRWLDESNETYTPEQVQLIKFDLNRLKKNVQTFGRIPVLVLAD